MIQDMLRETVQDWWRDLKEDRMSQIFTVAFLVIALSFGGWKGYQWYVAHKEGAAQMVFSEALNEYETVLHKLKKEPNEPAQWEDVLLNFDEVEAQHSGSLYALYSQGFRADIAARKGNLSDAIELLQKTIDGMKKTAPAYNMYRTKLALLYLDSGNEQEGLGLLQTLVDDTHNQQNDTAAFYLGYYYWTQEKFDKAKKAWQQFTKDKEVKESETVSPWTQIVQAKLSQIV